MHLSRADFSSLQTQHGLTFSSVFAVMDDVRFELVGEVCCFVAEARLSGGAGDVGSNGCAGVGDEREEKMPIFGLV